MIQPPPPPLRQLHGGRSPPCGVAQSSHLGRGRHRHCDRKNFLYSGFCDIPNGALNFFLIRKTGECVCLTEDVLSIRWLWMCYHWKIVKTLWGLQFLQLRIFWIHGLSQIMRPRERSTPQTSDLGAHEASCTISTDGWVGLKSALFWVDFNKVPLLGSLHFCAQ